ncbi:G1 family glutamic endopeptidase [Streptomyces sp. NPDC051162]|uniref:G1 family glutamic endopeptidase n=1 Tax=unclassified Streptomyces TaxID=2593676 RepID=UPI00343F2075
MTDPTERRRRRPALRRAIPRAVLAVVALACGLALAAPTAPRQPTAAQGGATAAAPAHTGPAGFDPYRGHVRPRAGKRRSQNGYNWSGYVAGGQPFATASATWTVPDISCSSASDSVAEWVGLDGWSNDTVEQTGVQESCETGTPTFDDWYEFYPEPPVYLHDRLKPGDVIHATVHHVSGMSYELTLNDETQNWTRTKKIDNWTAAGNSAEVIVESNHRLFPRFRQIDFTKARFNGAAPGAVGATSLWASSRGRQQNEVSELDGPGLDSFSVAYLSE